MGKPNFFIIGAPKCATTSLATWLAAHPRIYMSPEKEPDYFSLDLRRNDWIATLFPFLFFRAPGRRSPEAYEALFRDANESHLAVGEASTSYFFSREAVPAIEAWTGGTARYIVCLRNPVEMVGALHGQMLLNGNEYLQDLDRAWALGDARRAGRHIGLLTTWPAKLCYQDSCRLGSQLQRLLRTAPRERVHTVLLDDIREDPGREYRAVLAFLGVPDDGRRQFEHLNPGLVARSPRLTRIVKALSNMKSWLGVRKGFGLYTGMQHLNARPGVERLPAPESLRQEMREFFREDVALLGELLGRDLSRYTRPEP